MRIFSLFVLTLGASLASAQSYDFAADFSLSNNPSGAWSYGWTPAAGGALDLYGSHDVGTQLTGWNDTGDGKAAFLSLLKAQPGNIHGIVMGANDVAIHPGPSGERSVARFTSPVAGTFLLTATFDLVDTTNDGLPEDTDVDVAFKGASLGSGALSGYGSSKSYSRTLTLAVGDRIDFSVGYGASGLYYNDSTRLQATIAPVPEPASWALLGLGLLGLRRRRR